MENPQENAGLPDYFCALKMEKKSGNSFRAKKIQIESSESKKLFRRIFILLIFVALTTALELIDDKYKFLDNDILRKAVSIMTWTFGSMLIATVLVRLTERSIIRFFAVDKDDIEQRILVTKAWSAALYAVALTIPLNRLGLSAQNITLFLGFVATGLALAIRDILVSYIAWYIILNKKPFLLGDHIVVEDFSGLVKRIGIYYITLEKNDPHDIVKVPTSSIFSKIIRNQGHSRTQLNLKFPMSQLPADFEEKAALIKQYVMTLNQDPDPFNVRVIPNSDGEKMYLDVVFYLPYEKIPLKGAISAKIFNMNRDFLAISQASIRRMESQGS